MRLLGNPCFRFTLLVLLAVIPAAILLLRLNSGDSLQLDLGFAFAALGLTIGLALAVTGWRADSARRRTAAALADAARRLRGADDGVPVEPRGDGNLGAAAQALGELAGDPARGRPAGVRPRRRCSVARAPYRPSRPRCSTWPAFGTCRRCCTPSSSAPPT